MPPRRCVSNFERVISEHMLGIKFMSTSWKMALKWMPQNTFNDKSTLVQAIAWYHQATQNYPSQCWQRSMSLKGVTRPQRAKYFLEHDDIIKWNIFHVTGLLCEEFTGHRWTLLTKASDAVWINSWANNRDAGDLRCHHTHYHVVSAMK